MKIKSIKLIKFNPRLTKPFVYFMAKLNFLPYVLVEIKVDNGLVGYGEAALAWDVTGETQDGALGILKYIKPLVLDQEFNSLKELEQITSKINTYIYGNNALKAAIEMSLLDILGKEKKMPVFEILGGKNKDFVLAQKVFTFNYTFKEIQKNIKESLANGTKIIKLKVGQDFKKEITTISHICKMFPDVKLVFDVNQGWINTEIALRNIKQLEKYSNNISWIEQPILYYDYDGLAEIRKNTKIKIMADESCKNLFDLENLYYRQAIDLVNIKLAKTGGMIEMIKMIKFCEKNKIGYMLGDMISSSLGTAANLQAATLGNFVSYDITLPGSLKKDPFIGLEFDNCKAFIPKNTGLGVELSFDKNSRDKIFGRVEE